MFKKKKEKEKKFSIQRGCRPRGDKVRKNPFALAADHLIGQTRTTARPGYPDEPRCVVGLKCRRTGGGVQPCPCMTVPLCVARLCSTSAPRARRHVFLCRSGQELLELAARWWRRSCEIHVPSAILNDGEQVGGSCAMPT